MNDANHKIQQFVIDQLTTQGCEILAFDAEHKDYSILYEQQGKYYITHPLYAMRKEPEQVVHRRSEIIANYIESGFELGASDLMHSTLPLLKVFEYLDDKSASDRLGIFEKEFIAPFCKYITADDDTRLDISKNMKHLSYGELLRSINEILPSVSE